VKFPYCVHCSSVGCQRCSESTLQELLEKCQEWSQLEDPTDHCDITDHGCGVVGMRLRADRIIRWPTTLAVYVSRVLRTETGGYYKDRRTVLYPLCLQGALVHDAKYRLRSVIVHTGGVAGGHYHCYVRSAGVEFQKCDTGSVQACDVSVAMRQEATMLIYESD
jgi:ubiquitin C-terminal hydrolase